VERDKQKKSESVGQTLPQLSWKQKRGGIENLLDSIHQTSRNFVGISTVVCGIFCGLKKNQNDGRCHGNQGAKNVKLTPNFTNFCSNVSCHNHI
jgi:hypothetical protein